MSSPSPPQNLIAPTTAFSSRPARGFHRLWKRKSLLAAGLVICTFLGGVYYSTAARDYSAIAELTISNESSPSGNGTDVSEALTTYRQMLTSTAVLERVVESMPQEVWLAEKQLLNVSRIEHLRNRLTILPLPETSALRVSYQSSHPKIAAFTLKRLLDSFQRHLEASRETFPHPELEALTKEQATLEREFTSNETELAALEKQAELEFGDLDEAKRRLLDRVAHLDHALSEAQKERIATEAFLAVIEANLALGRETRENEFPPVSQETIATAQTRQSLIQNQTELRELQLQYGASHPRIRELHEKIRLTEQWLQNRDTIRTVSYQQFQGQTSPSSLTAARQKTRSAQANEASLRRQLESERASVLKLNEQMARLEILRFDHRRLKAKQELLQERIKHIAREPIDTAQATITVPPEIPTRPTHPKLGHVIAVSQVMGVLLGLGFVYVAEKRSHVLRALQRLSRRLNVPVLALIGELPPTGGHGFDSISSWASPDSEEVEPFLSLMTGLSQSPKPIRRLAVTSALGGEGKTIAAANLAVASAQAGLKTLLIDADLNRCGLTGLLEIQGPRGLSAMLSDHRPVAECAKDNIVPMLQPGLDLLPAGPRTRWSSQEPLTKHRVQKLLAWAESRYDQLIVDCPPFTEPAAKDIGELADGAFLIVDLQKDRSRRADDLKDLDTTLIPKLLGIVGNRVW